MYYSRNVKDQMQYPRKIYFTDNGFLKYLSFRPGESRFLENMAAVELKRRGHEFYYWKNLKGEEVDFVIMEKDQVRKLIQVSVDISQPETKEREVRALLKAMKHFGITDGLILTNDSEEVIQDNGVEIAVKPVWKWLLDTSISNEYKVK